MFSIFLNLIDRKQSSSCLFNKPEVKSSLKSNGYENDIMRLINEKSRNVLPGTRFNINEQCMQKYGKKSSHYRKGVSF